MIKHYVLAGNYREFRNWCSDNNVSIVEAMFVSEPSQFRGRWPTSETKIHYVGTFDSSTDKGYVLKCEAELFLLKAGK